MTTYIALLRGVNVAGNQMIGMSNLRDAVAKMGFANVRSLMQSGNLIFQSGNLTCGQIERRLEIETENLLNLTTDFFVRTTADLAKIIEANPFREEAERDPAHLVAMFLKHEPESKQIADLESAIAGPERISAAGKLAYIVYPTGIGRSKLTNALIDRKLQTRGTGRNWNTVLKLAAASAE